MLTFVRLRLGAAVAAAVLAATSMASAATVNLSYQPFTRANLAQAQAAAAAVTGSLSSVRYEGFESYQPWGTGSGTQDLRNTAVGSFTPFGTTGSGKSVVGSGTSLQVRADNQMYWGRYNDNGAGGLQPGNWLDSNDNRGIKWTIDGIGSFDRIGFFLGDVADVGGKFSIKVGDTLYRNLANGARLPNGNLYYVTILLSEMVDSLTIKLFHDVHNDGFGIDNIVVASAAPIPLPPTLLLMAPALGLVAVARRRRRAA